MENDIPKLRIDCYGKDTWLYIHGEPYIGIRKIEFIHDAVMDEIMLKLEIDMKVFGINSVGVNKNISASLGENADITVNR